MGNSIEIAKSPWTPIEQQTIVQTIVRTMTMNITKLSSTGRNSDSVEALAPISDFSRSLHLTELLKDKSLREAYAAAQADGQLPTNRARVLILGEPRAGKTSLLNRLMGREFDIREQPTEGIETRMCHVTNVDKQWNESEGAKADDIQQCASVVTALGEMSSAIKATTLGSDTSRKNDPTQTHTLPDLMKIGLQLFCLFVVVFGLCLLKYGYTAFVWCTFGALTLMHNYNFAYRLATYISLFCVLFDTKIRRDILIEAPSCQEREDGFENRTIWSTLQSMVLDAINSIMLGVANGFGCRTGVAVAFSASLHPEEIKATREAAAEGPVISWDMLVLSVISSAGILLGIGCYSFCTFNDRWHKYRTATCCGLLAWLLALSLKGDCRNRRYWFLFLNGIMMSIQETWGMIVGRRASHKYGVRASYVSKKIVGFIFGLYLSYILGWTMRIPNSSLPSVTLYLLSIMAHPLFDLHNTYKVWREKSTFPVKLIREQMKTVLQRQPVLKTKLSLWDFAGDTLYHCTHHVFMPDRALYVIVFNLHAAVSDEDGQLQKLLFWLHSVCAHACHPDAVIIIVGTHKASVSDVKKLRFTEELHRRITPHFCHRLVLNPLDDKPLFLVDNSQPVHEDFQQLRAQIFRRVESAEYAQERYPIKYLLFYRQIQNRRKLAETDCAAYVMTLDQISDLARDTCDVTNEDDLKSMLRFFGEAGELIHKDDDDILRQHVVLDPQFLVDVMKKLLRIPRGSKRSHRFAVDWKDYESSGIITEGLMQHIYSDMSHLVPLLTKLLQAYDLMCQVAFVLNPKYPQKSFLVPAMLPPYRGESVNFWKPQSKEEVFYFDFGSFNPSTVYYRLLTRCLTHAILDKFDSNSKPLIFADRCRFHIGTSFIFKLQLERRSSQQMLLSVTVLAFEQQNPVWNLLKFLLNVVKSITARDYPQLCFSFGPRCPYCVHEANLGRSIDDILKDTCENNIREEANIHVLKMAGNDQPFPTMSPAVMLCGQKRYELVLSGYKSLDADCGSCHLPQRVAFTTKTPITRLPPDLFHKVCLLLNDTHGIRNWKALAGELGKDVESVAVLDSQRITNPTECLLREWAMIDGHVTVSDLLEVLGRPLLQRMDVIQEIRAQMAQE
ncbi:uncharacterized protein LOC119723261 [Patiria miniata]|uniref:Death domain-containing protein n=1 Tax=Patiria miniata TaxID=46514 RepID=A0A913ZE47_PATMI|nr:uncharacterized protein LOC119723261 [Patiria miniata]